MSGAVEIILTWTFVGVLWVLARNVGYRQGFRDGYKQSEKDFKQSKAIEDEPQTERSE